MRWGWEGWGGWVGESAANEGKDGGHGEQAVDMSATTITTRASGP